MADDPSSTGVPPKVRLWVAVSSFVAYVAALVALAVAADNVSATVWERYVFLLTGAEAIVFAAVGWLFGREVNRGQAEQAEKATKDATEAARGEAHARATLREFARTVADTARAAAPDAGAGAGAGAGTEGLVDAAPSAAPSAPDASLATLHQLAQRHLQDD